MAEKACHVFGSTTQVGLTQVLGLVIEIISIFTILPLALYFGVLVAAGFFSSNLYWAVVVLAGTALAFLLMSAGFSMSPLSLLLAVLIFAGFILTSWLAALCIRSLDRSYNQSRVLAKQPEA